MYPWKNVKCWWVHHWSEQELIDIIFLIGSRHKESKTSTYTVYTCPTVEPLGGVDPSIDLHCVNHHHLVVIVFDGVTEPWNHKWPLISYSCLMNLSTGYCNTLWHPKRILHHFVNYKVMQELKIILYSPL